MKKSGLKFIAISLITFCCTLSTIQRILAQTSIPQVVSFSAVVRDANNQLLANTPVSLRLTFRKGGQTGPEVYCALHQGLTNANGFVSIQLNRNVLGTACNGAPATTFENIPWQEGGFWMEVEYQTTVPNTPFVSLGLLELASSFYAFAAGTAEQVKGVQLQGAQNGQVLAYNQSSGKWEPTAATAGPGLPNGSAPGELMYWNGTAWVNLAAPQTQGQVLTFCNGILTWTTGGICPGGSVVDLDGNTYTAVTIGSQVWMKENLKVSKYRNGDAIPTNLDDAAWGSTTTGSFAIFNIDVDNITTYGKLYNWYAVADPRGLCPAGWHVPTDHDWQLLTKYLDPAADTTQCCSNIAGGKMKSIGTREAGTGLWYAPNQDATNSSGFTALPGGCRDYFGALCAIATIGFWWSSTENSSTSAWNRGVGYSDGYSFRGSLYFKQNGFSVRCLRD